MDKTDLLPVPIHYVTLSERYALLTKRPTIEIVMGPDEILTPDEQRRFASDLTSVNFGKEGYVLRIKNNGVSIFAYTGAGEYRGRKTLDRILSKTNGVLPNVLIVDYPAFAIRGFMEGYTGYPWAEHRGEMIERCAGFGFNTFVLGPNEFDLLIKWREKFPKEYRDHLASLAARADANFVNFAYKVIPFGVDMSSQSDVEAFKRKTEELADIGVQAIVIGLDDFFRGQTAEDHGRAHAKFANKIAKELGRRNVLVYLVPAIYHRGNRYLSALGNFVPIIYHDKDKYFSTLGRELDERVQVGWTGRKIVSPEVTLGDAENLEGLLRRKPFLGHNFPVVNETDRKRIIYLGPLKGLDPHLADYLDGISFNFMPLPFASLIPGLTCADYAWNPRDYNPKKSARNSSLANGSLDLLRLVELNPETSVDPRAVHPLTRVINGGNHHKPLSRMTEDEKQQLRETFTMMSALAYTLLPPTIDPRLYDELKPLLYQASAVGGLGEGLLDGNLSKVGLFPKIFAGVKMIGGYRFSGVEVENWIMREMGFPVSLMPNLRILADVKDRILRGRHSKQK
ncbi:beta-N-acetylglucosaminidase domain-containing protein [Candidatus Woesearchaeota archaeon]|nr:beta-N-acetylglucosaminidase domain-containing protein [Candidatus Woesearchaeota archaeon]